MQYKKLDSVQQAVPSQRDSAEDVKHCTVSEFQQACMIGKSHRAYVILDIDDVKFLCKAAWLPGTRGTFVQRNAIPALLDSKWDFSSARTASCVAFG